MANLMLKKLEDQLVCSICQKIYTNPKQLQCNHVYCQQCLICFRDHQGILSLSCPKCCEVTPVPDNGVGDLQAAFRANVLLEIVEEYKRALDDSAKAEGASASPPQDVFFCKDHSGEKVVIYCETCGETICWKCIMKGERHHDHKYEELSKAFEKHKKEVSSLLEPIEAQLTEVDESLSQLVARRDEILDQRATIERKIHDTIARLHEALEARRTKLIAQLHDLTQAKLKGLAPQIDQLKTTEKQLRSCLGFMRERLDTGSQEEALVMISTAVRMVKTTTAEQVNKLASTFQQDDKLTPNTEADIIFSEIAGLSAALKNYGKVYTATSPDLSKCSVSGKVFAVMGERSSVTLVIQNYKCQPCKQELTSSISCDLISEIKRTSTSTHVERKMENQYEISYQPTIKGRHQLRIKVEGHHIKGSPFPILVWSEKLDSVLFDISGVEQPAGVAVNQRGEVVVCEQQHLSVHNPYTGRTLESHAWQSHYVGIALDGMDNVYYADNSNHRIYKYTSELFFAFLEFEKTGPLPTKNICSLTFNATNCRLYLVDSGNFRILILNSDLNYCGTFGKIGTRRGQFQSPRCIACDSSGNVYVTDRHFPIQVFTPDGKFLRTIGYQGVELMEPSCLAVDYSDRVYVGEPRNNHVYVFTSDGVCLRQLCFFYSQHNMCPSGIAVDIHGLVYVCDYEKNKVQVF